jgi:hypothetical protein
LKSIYKKEKDKTRKVSLPEREDTEIYEDFIKDKLTIDTFTPGKITGNIPTKKYEWVETSEYSSTTGFYESTECIWPMLGLCYHKFTISAEWCHPKKDIKVVL